MTDPGCRDATWDYGHLTSALELAAWWHRGQCRKGSDTPYLSHLLGVAELVMLHGGDDHEVAAALLHDAVEDGGGEERLPEIRSACGTRTAEIVESCSDSMVDTSQEEKPPWIERKLAYRAHLREPKTDGGALLVSACDKLHNLAATRRDFETIGADVWTRFKTGWQGQVWYYRELLGAYRSRDDDDRVQEVADRLSEELDALTALLREAGYPVEQANTELCRYLREDAELQMAAEELASDPERALNDNEIVARILRDIEQDSRNAELMAMWGTSSVVEDSKHLIPEALAGLIRSRTGQSATATSLHAGLAHTYGYLLSAVATEHGYKRRRWLTGDMARTLGDPDGIVAFPAKGTLLSNLTAALAPILAGQSGLVGADGTTIERLTETPDGDGPRLRTYLLSRPMHRPVVVYTAEVGGRELLVTAFDVSRNDAEKIRGSAQSGRAEIRLRYNATLPDGRAGPWTGTVTLEGPTGLGATANPAG